MLELSSTADHRMELLATLSPTPVKAKNLCEDFGFERVKDLREALSHLVEFGVRLGYPHRNREESGRGVHVWIEQTKWKKARQAASDYWDEQYGTEP